MDGGQVHAPRRLKLPVSNAFGEGEMAVLDFGPQDRPVDMVFAHANGFNAYTYRQLLTQLAQDQGIRIWAPDLRGHGRTRLPTERRRRANWHDHRDDLVSLLDHLDHPVIFCGHSIGGTSGLLAAEKLARTHTSKIRHLILLDPVIWPPLTVAAFNMPGLSTIPSRVPIVKSTLRRREVFDSRNQAFSSWQGRGAFKGWPDQVLSDYLVDGLVEEGDTYRLSCSPLWEASNYAAQSHNPWRALRRYRGPVSILRAEHGSLCAVSKAMSRKNLNVQTVKGAGHLFPMTHPDVVEDAVRQALV